MFFKHESNISSYHCDDMNCRSSMNYPVGFMPVFAAVSAFWEATSPVWLWFSQVFGVLYLSCVLASVLDLLIATSDSVITVTYWKGTGNMPGICWELPFLPLYFHSGNYSPVSRQFYSLSFRIHTFLVHWEHCFWLSTVIYAFKAINAFKVI